MDLASANNNDKGKRVNEVAASYGNRSFAYNAGDRDEKRRAGNVTCDDQCAEWRIRALGTYKKEVVLLHFVLEPVMAQKDVEMEIETGLCFSCRETTRSHSEEIGATAEAYDDYCDARICAKKKRQTYEWRRYVDMDNVCKVAKKNRKGASGVLASNDEFHTHLLRGTGKGGLV